MDDFPLFPCQRVHLRKSTPSVDANEQVSKLVPSCAAMLCQPSRAVGILADTLGRIRLSALAYPGRAKASARPKENALSPTRPSASPRSNTRRTPDPFAFSLLFFFLFPILLLLLNPTFGARFPFCALSISISGEE